jgi:DNA polymerase-3 subunit gamma/tau
VYIIDEAHQLTKDAFNVLLKLVEEPPEHLRFIFATTEPDKIIPTLRSRTHHYPFRLVSAKTLQEHMAALCEKEAIAFEPAALTLIARAGAGSVRDSLSVLGQIIAGSGTDGITYSETVSLLGFTDELLLSQVVDAIAIGDAAKLFNLIDQVVASGHEPRRFAIDLLERMRDLVVAKQVPDAAQSGLIDLPSETIEELVKQAGNFTPAQLVRVADLVSAGLSELRGASSPRLQLELLVARLVTPEVTNDLVERVTRLEQSGVSAPASRPSLVREQAAQASSAVPIQPEEDLPAVVAKPSEPPLASRKPNAAPPLKPSQVTGAARKTRMETTPQDMEAKFSGEVSIDVLRKNWPLILEKMRASSKVAHTLVSETRPLSLTNGILVVGFAQAGLVKNATSSPHLKTLQSIINDVFSVKVQIDPTLDPNAAKIVAPKITETVETGDADPNDSNDPEISTIDLIAQTLGATVISESPRE